MKEPDFDVAITTYDRAKFMIEAVKSCLSQGEHLKNVIVVDDASSDDTKDKLREINDDRIKYYRRKVNGGIGAARKDAFSLSEADWTIMLDSDHELLPGAIDCFYAMAIKNKNICNILGGRFLWDDGGVTPKVVPVNPINYEQKIWWSNVPGGLRNDHVFAISKKIRRLVAWLEYRGGAVDTLFHLDIAKLSKTAFTEKCLAMQKSNAPIGHTRGNPSDRMRRRELDASDVIKVIEIIIERHGKSLEEYGRKYYADILQIGSFYALLNSQKNKGREWLYKSLKIDAITFQRLGLIVGYIFGKNMFKLLYKIRG